MAGNSERISQTLKPYNEQPELVGLDAPTSVELPPRRGFAFRDGIVSSQTHSETYRKRALGQRAEEKEGRELERLIVMTDEQSHDGILPAWAQMAYVVNVAPYKHGLSYGNGWTHVDGWFELRVDYIPAVESESTE